MHPGKTPIFIMWGLSTKGFGVRILKEDKRGNKMRRIVYEYVAEGEKAPRRGFEPRT